MKINKKTFFNYFFAITAMIGVCMFGWNVVYPNVVTGIKPLQNLPDSTKNALERIIQSENRDSAVKVAVAMLPGEGGIESKICYWLHCKTVDIDSISFALLSGIGLKTESLDRTKAIKIVEGHVRNQVIVKIYFKAKPMEEYFLQCSNGLVERRWSNLVNEEKISTLQVIQPERVIIPKGGSLCQTLGVTEREAFKIVRKTGLPYSYKKGRFHDILYVWICESSIFKKEDGEWRYVDCPNPGNCHLPKNTKINYPY